MLDSHYFCDFCLEYLDCSRNERVLACSFL